MEYKFQNQLKGLEGYLDQVLDEQRYNYEPGTEEVKTRKISILAGCRKRTYQSQRPKQKNILKATHLKPLEISKKPLKITNFII